MTFQEYRLDALTTELWRTQGEQGRKLGSYDLARHEFSKAQWLERPTGIPGRSWVRLPLGNSEKLFSV